MDQLSEVRREAEKAKLMNQTCRKLSDQIRTLEAEHQTVQDELNRYQTRNDQLIKQNKVQFVNWWILNSLKSDFNIRSIGFYYLKLANLPSFTFDKTLHAKIIA